MCFNVYNTSCIRIPYNMDICKSCTIPENHFVWRRLTFLREQELISVIRATSSAFCVAGAPAKLQNGAIKYLENEKIITTTIWNIDRNHKCVPQIQHELKHTIFLPKRSFPWSYVINKWNEGSQWLRMYGTECKNINQYTTIRIKPNAINKDRPLPMLLSVYPRFRWTR